METEITKETIAVTEPIAMLIATLVGGIISIVTTWIISRNSRKLMKKEMSLPRLFNALEEIELLIIKLRKEQTLDDTELDRFTIACGWLPNKLNENGIKLISKIHRNEDYADLVSSFHSEIRKYKQDLIS